MAEHDFIIDNGTGSAVRTDLNNLFQAIASNNSKSGALTTNYAYQWHVDTSDGNLKIRNAANNGYVTIGPVATTNFGLAPLTGGTFTGSVTFEDAINENVFAITDASSVALDPDNGMIQTWTLGANRTATDSLTAAQSLLLMVTAGSYTLTWPTITWAGGSAPTLSTTAITAIELWKVGSNLYGANVGNL